MSTLYLIVAISVQFTAMLLRSRASGSLCVWYTCMRAVRACVCARVCARVQVFVDAKAQVKDKPEEFVRVCMQLLDAPRLEAAVQVRVHGRTHPHTGCRNLRSCQRLRGANEA